MSHYLVAVIHREDQDIKDLLAPFDEAKAKTADEAKWDWYEVGGRFRTNLRNKRGQIVTSCRLDDIDFEPRSDIYDECKDFYEVVVNGKEKKPGVDYFTLFKPEYYKDHYGSADYFAKCEASFSTYAVLTPDGKWHESAPMGWFGCSAATPEQFKAWYDGYEKLIKDLDKDLIMTIVDCHI